MPRVAVPLCLIFVAAILSVASIAPPELDPGPQVKTAVIDSADGGCFFFSSGSTTCTDQQPDVVVEPWCTQRPGICGNWVETEHSALDQITTPPESGYISDVAGFTDCQEASTNKVLVFKLGDDSFAKGIITADAYTETPQGCDHKVTLEYLYPM